MAKHIYDIDENTVDSEGWESTGEWDVGNYEAFHNGRLILSVKNIKLAVKCPACAEYAHLRSKLVSRGDGTFAVPAYFCQCGFSFRDYDIEEVTIIPSKIDLIIRMIKSILYDGKR
jgi:hypothetical protein